MNIKGLIEDVLTSLGENKPIDEIASKGGIIARGLKNKDFQTWVDNEFFNGYINIEESKIPGYRKTTIVGVEANFSRYIPTGIETYKDFSLSELLPHRWAEARADKQSK